MATYDPAATRAAIKNLLSTATEIQNVYDFMNPSIDGYPAIIFDLDSEDGSFLDDVTNVRTLIFKVWIAVEVQTAGQSAAKDYLDVATKSIVNLVEKLGNQTLSGNIDWIMPAVGQRNQTTSPEGNFMYQELLLKCNVASTIL